jgi:hypothetical protein
MGKMSYYMHSVRNIINKARNMNDRAAAKEYLRREYERRSRPWRILFDSIYKEEDEQN